LGASLAKYAGHAGAMTGLLVAGLDAYKGYSEFIENADGLLVVSYWSSALFGGISTFSLAFIPLLGSVAIPVIGLLVLLLIGIGIGIGIGILIELIKDNPIQD